MPLPQIMKEGGTSLSTIYRVINSLKEQRHIKRKSGSGRKSSVFTTGKSVSSIAEMTGIPWQKASMCLTQH